MIPDPKVYNKEERRLIDIGNKMMKEAERILRLAEKMKFDREWEADAPNRQRRADELLAYRMIENPLFHGGPAFAMELHEKYIRSGASEA